VVVTQTWLRRLTSELSATIKQQELAITRQREFRRSFMREIKVGVDTISVLHIRRDISSSLDLSIEELLFFVLDLEKCTNCVAGELACSMEHHGEYNPAKSRITVFDFP
jgi:hypothetical protein